MIDRPAQERRGRGTRYEGRALRWQRQRQRLADSTLVPLARADIGARYHFVSPTRALVPYLEAALSGRVAAQDDVVIEEDIMMGDLEISGAGFTFGGGLLYFFNPQWALNTNLNWTVGEFSTVKFENVSVDGFEIDATTTRFNIGIAWFPMSGR